MLAIRDLTGIDSQVRLIQEIKRNGNLSLPIF